MIVFLNGQFVDSSKAKISIFDHGFLYGDGVYETLRLRVKGQGIRDKGSLFLHLRRLRASARAINLRIPWTDSQLTEWIYKTVWKNKFMEARVRLTVTRGENGFEFLTTKRPMICIIVEKLELPLTPPFPPLVKGGRFLMSTLESLRVEVITFSMERTLPEVKSISLLPMVLARQAAEKKKVYEALLVDRDGFVTEGSITNFFIVKNGVLITPEEDILKGTMRERILKMLLNKNKEAVLGPPSNSPLRKGGEFKVVFRKVKKEELYEADECFICNAPRGIVPVGKIDGRKIGDGKMGEVTRRIMEIGF